jgi:hypothetical protein
LRATSSPKTASAPTKYVNEISALRRRFVEELTEQVAADDPPYSLDYCRLNIHARWPD